VPELEAVVHVAAKDALRQLVQAGRLFRREWQGRFLWFFQNCLVIFNWDFADF
jgi:hypothetical protein